MSEGQDKRFRMSSERAPVRFFELEGIRAMNSDQFEAQLTTAIARLHDQAGEKFALAVIEFERFRLIANCLTAPAEALLWGAVFDRLNGLVDAWAASDSSQSRRTTSIWSMGAYGPFAVLLEGVDTQASAQAEISAIVTAMEKPFQLSPEPGAAHDASSTAHDHQIGLCPYAGIAYPTHHYATANEAISDAHLALCAAATHGSGFCATFEPSMRRLTRSKLETEAGLRRAVALGELVLYYQPIVDLHDGTTAGFEALVRWNHPFLGIVPPGNFIPVAEETGLIGPIGQWVLYDACLRQAKWRADAVAPDVAPWVSVNLSRRQLEQPDLVERIAEILKTTGAIASDVHIEITESVIMEAPNAIQTLKSLRDLGLFLSMDDFGTGYSSLACLHQLPLNTIKIDRSFVSRLCESRDFAAAVHAIVSLTSNLHLEAVAEGIETADQVVLLQALDCHYGQGYYFGKPMPADEASKYRFHAANPPSESSPNAAAA